MDTRQDWSALDRLRDQFLDCMDLYHVANDSEDCCAQKGARAFARNWPDLCDFEDALYEFQFFFHDD